MKLTIKQIERKTNKIVDEHTTERENLKDILDIIKKLEKKLFKEYHKIVYVIEE